VIAIISPDQRELTAELFAINSFWLVQAIEAGDRCQYGTGNPRGKDQSSKRSMSENVKCTELVNKSAHTADDIDIRDIEVRLNSLHRSL
jgi:hypothetical protein